MDQIPKTKKLKGCCEVLQGQTRNPRKRERKKKNKANRHPKPEAIQ